LPKNRQAREDLIDDIYHWLDQQKVSYEAVLNLYRGEEFVLDQHATTPGDIVLTSEQFGVLQDVWEQSGMPRDLYYPARAEISVVEPAEMYGGVVRVQRKYSPLRWAHRDQAKIDALRVPSEEERIEAFTEACLQFHKSLVLRVYELQEPWRETERETDQEELKSLRKLAVGVSSWMFRVRVDPHRLSEPSGQDKDDIDEQPGGNDAGSGAPPEGADPGS
jgi:hypothetical protein